MRHFSSCCIEFWLPKSIEEAQISLKMVPGGVPGGVPGEPGGIEKPKVERRGRQERRPLIRPPPFGSKSRQKRPQGAPQGAIWELFLSSFRGVFSRFLLTPLFIDFEKHSAPILGSFLVEKSSLGTPRRDKVDREKSLFYHWKTILFDF